jgi:hypothetical protein
MSGQSIPDCENCEKTLGTNSACTECNAYEAFSKDCREELELSPEEWAEIELTLHIDDPGRFLG